MSLAPHLLILYVYSCLGAQLQTKGKRVSTFQSTVKALVLSCLVLLQPILAFAENDNNPNLDADYEGAVLKDELWRRLISWFAARLEMRMSARARTAPELRSASGR